MTTKTELRAAEKRLAELEAELVTAERELEAAHAEYVRVCKPDAVSRPLKPAPGSHEAMQRFSTAEARVDSIDSDIKEARREIDRLRARAGAGDALARARDALQRLQAERETATVALDGKRQALEALQADLAALQAEVAQVRGAEAAALAAKALGRGTTAAAAKRSGDLATLQAREAAMTEALALVDREIATDEAALSDLAGRIAAVEGDMRLAAMHEAQAIADAALAAAIPALVKARQATAAVWGYSAWSVPDLKRLMADAERQAEAA